MGFWQGVARGYSEIRNQRREERLIEEDREAQKKALAEERERQDAMRAEDRAFERENLMTTLAERRRLALLERAGKNSRASAEAEPVLAKTQALASRLGEDAIASEEGQRLINNPMLAAQVEDWVVGIQESFAEKGMEAPNLSGANLLEMVQVYGLPQANPQGGVDTESILNATPEEIMNFDIESITPTQTPQPYLQLDTPIMPDPKVLSEGRDAVSREVLRLANQELERVSDDPAMAANMQKLIDGFDADSPTQETEALLTRFGPKAYENVSGMDNMYTRGLPEDPFMQRFLTLPEQAQVTIQALNDPNIPPEQAMQLRELLFNKYGIQY